MFGSITLFDVLLIFCPPALCQNRNGSLPVESELDEFESPSLDFNTVSTSASIASLHSSFGSSTTSSEKTYKK
ncbi:hypothetical protein ACHAWO_004457 [Cyclotella atomus]|uniref:Uncharacterized protein n=1 Tax=Cyclotella atomus TaxID=382360 RepID=A0ABD3P044_9STRA